MTQRPMTANAWQRDASVDFRGTGISESIEVDPRGYTGNPTGLADIVDAVALLIRDGQSPRGDRVVLRPWFNLNFGDQPRVFYSPNDRADPNAWPQVIDPFESPTIPATTLAWHDAFNARVVANGTAPDYCMLDNEDRPSFYYFQNEAQRQAYFEPLTIDDGNNPYPGGAAASPYIGQNIWSYASPDTDAFISDYEQSSYERMAAVLARLHAGMFAAGQASAYATAHAQVFGASGRAYPAGVTGPLPISNYEDQSPAFQIGDAQGRPNRLPRSDAAISDISAPIAYFDRRDLPLFAEEPAYTTERQIANRQRWKSILYRLNACRAAAATPGMDVHPWIQSPGWGWNEGEGWATATTLPFELMLWRVFMAHLEAMGIATYNLWNPIPSTPGTNDPNSATTHAFMAAYFTGRTVPDLDRDLPLIDYGVDFVQTKTAQTKYRDLFEITDLHFARRQGVHPYLEGFGTRDSPLLVDLGATGDAQLAAMKTAIETVQGTQIRLIRQKASAGHGGQVLRRKANTLRRSRRS